MSDRDSIAQSKAPDPQKPLTVDRDPVVSPDPADNLPGPEIQPPSVSSGSGESEKLTKGDHGYTLRRDVEEVVLNATVLDDHNKLVMNLTKPDFSCRRRRGSADHHLVPARGHPGFDGHPGQITLARCATNARR